MADMVAQAYDSKSGRQRQRQKREDRELECSLGNRMNASIKQNKTRIKTG